MIIVEIINSNTETTEALKSFVNVIIQYVTNKDSIKLSLDNIKKILLLLSLKKLDINV